jgi:hypothetical protein
MNLCSPPNKADGELMGRRQAGGSVLSAPAILTTPAVFSMKIQGELK